MTKNYKNILGILFMPIGLLVVAVLLIVMQIKYFVRVINENS